MRQSSPSRFGRIKARPPYAAPGQVIGLLGGSFNPPHAAHLSISEAARKRLGLHKVWWLVSPGNPLKKRSETPPLAERLIQCRAVATSPHIVVTGFEADLPTPHTISTLSFLKSRLPLVRFVWIMGADNLAGLERWERWREIFALVPVAVVDRPGWRLKALASRAARAFASQRLAETEARLLAHTPAPAWTFLTGPLSHASSTAIRNKAKARSKPVAKKLQAGAEKPELPWKKARTAEARMTQSGPTVAPHSDTA